MAILWISLISYYIYKSLSIVFPSESNPIVCYFEESGDDLKYLYCSFLKKAKKHIFISSFGMTDPDIHKILKEKKSAGIKVTYHNCKQEKKTRKKISGLYHKKILIIDGEQLYIGSANCSLSSLCFHGNQIFGFFDKALIESVFSNSSLVKEEFEFYSLPESREKSFDRLQQIIQNAKKSILISMYALTHKQLTEEIIHAKQRGVEVKIYLDSQMIKGAMSKQAQMFKAAKIPLFVRAKGGLNHHKCALIDNTYIFGSINWSEAGFKKNEETLMILHHMDTNLKKQIEQFFKNLDFYSIDF
jgi:cardiolipin synthase